MLHILYRSQHICWLSIMYKIVYELRAFPAAYVRPLWKRAWASQESPELRNKHSVVRIWYPLSAKFFVKWQHQCPRHIRWTKANAAIGSGSAQTHDTFYEEGTETKANPAQISMSHVPQIFHARASLQGEHTGCVDRKSW